jgi:hypothetical protein
MCLRGYSYRNCENSDPAFSFRCRLPVAEFRSEGAGYQVIAL